MDLNDFIAQAVALKAAPKAKKPKVKKADKDEAFKKTQAELRALRLEACVPTSVHLFITHQECECGERFISVNKNPLVKRVGKNLVYFEQIKTRETFDRYATLPYYQEIQVKNLHTCSSCAGAPDEVFYPTDEDVPHEKA